MHCKVIWDLDGTLLYTLDDLAAAVNHALRLHHMPERSLDEVRQMVGNGVRRLMLRAVPGGESNPDFESAFTCFCDYYKAHCRDNTRPYPGIPELLRTLHEAGVGMAIVSNKLQAGVTPLHAEWFSDTINVAIGEREGIRRKPAPDMLELAIRELGADRAHDNIYYVGDADTDIMTAQAAGLPCISVLWGFRSREFLLEHGATLLAESPEDILNIIKEP